MINTIKKINCLTALLIIIPNLNLCILSGQSKSFHILLDTFPVSCKNSHSINFSLKHLQCL